MPRAETQREQRGQVPWEQTEEKAAEPPVLMTRGTRQWPAEAEDYQKRSIRLQTQLLLMMMMMASCCRLRSSLAASAAVAFEVASQRRACWAEQRSRRYLGYY